MPEYRSTSGSAAEDLFIDLFADTFGAEKAGYLYSQYPFYDIYQNARFADFVLENGATRVAIEIDDEASHNPRLVSQDKFYDDLLKQNSMIHLGWDVYRWAVRQMQKQPETVKDELRVFDPSRLKPGIAWQVEQLENMQWIDEGQNLVIIGKCDTGKTTLAAHIGQIALRKKETVYYCNIEEFLRVIKNKDKSRKTEIIYRYILDCSVIIVDDVMYANIMPEDLPLFYRAVSFLNEERSLIIITNRELSGWITAAEDTHLMQTLVDRITANSQIIRL